MKVLERYILGEFTKLLVMAVAAFIILFVVVDVFENMDDLMERGVPLGRSVAFFAYKIPFIVGQVSPIAVLLAVLLSLGIFARHSEVTAIKAGGIRLSSVLKPLLAAGLAISVGVILMNETLTPAAMKKAESFRTVWLEGVKGSYGRQGMWIKGDDGIYNIRHLDLATGELRGVSYFATGRDFRASRRVQARLLRWRDGAWVAPKATLWEFSERGVVTERVESDLVMPGPGPPEDLASVGSGQENMAFFELARYVRDLESDGYDARKYRIDLYDKLAFPLVNFIMVLVGVPFALKTGRHSGIAVGVGLSVAIAFSYWVVFAVTRSLGTGGMLPPLVSAVFPDVLFAAVGLLMYGQVRQ